MKNIMVVYGGISVEHDVSVITGVLTLNALDKNKYNPVPVYVGKDGAWYTGDLFDIDGYKKLNFKKLKKVTLTADSNVLYQVKKNRLKRICDIAVAINCLHGGGEGGSLAGLLTHSKIPLASPDVFASSVAMDKAKTKIALKGLNVKTLPYAVTDGRIDEKEIEKIGFPLIVKPSSTGSSIGIRSAENKEELKSAISYALRYDRTAIIEKMLFHPIEINCSAYKNDKGEIIVSECEKPICKGKILSFDDKYVDGEREFPAKIDKKYSNKIRKITEKVYDKLSFTGIIRIDFFIYEGEIYINEINSVPGSLAYYLFSDTLKGFTEILNNIISFAEKEFAKQSTVIKEYKTTVLSIDGIKGGKSKKRL